MSALIPGMPAQRPNDVRGWLTFVSPLPNDLQNAEDSTQEADIRLHTGKFRIRPATPTERVLLQHLGYDLSAHPNLTTTVRYLSHTMRRREWPALALQTPTTPTSTEGLP